MRNEQEKSPFAEQSFELQQQRWMEWRLRQLDYRHEEADARQPDGEKLPPLQIPAPVKISGQTGNSYRHSQLDQINARHKAAMQTSASWNQTVTRQEDTGQAQ